MLAFLSVSLILVRVQRLCFVWLSARHCIDQIIRGAFGPAASSAHDDDDSDDDGLETVPNLAESRLRALVLIRIRQCVEK